MPLVSLPTATLTPIAASGYPNLADLKAYLGVAQTDDDTLLQNAILQAIAWAESNEGAGFSFEATADSIHLFGAKEDGTHVLDWRTLYFDCPLAAVTEVIINEGITLAASDYSLLPLNSSPKWGLRLKTSSGYSLLDYTTDFEEAISIEGRWGYATTCPHDIRQAILEIAAFYYRRKDQSIASDRTIVNQVTGQVLEASKIPSSAAEVIRSKRNTRFL